MMPTNALSTEVSRVEPHEPAQSHVNPLLRIHLLLYGRYKWAILLGLVLGACGAAYVWKSMPPKWQVTGFVRVKPYIPPVLNVTDQNGILPMFETFVSLQVSLLQSQRVLDQARLNPDWKALGHMSWCKSQSTFDTVLEVLGVVGTIAGVVGGVAGAASAVAALRSL